MVRLQNCQSACGAFGRLHQPLRPLIAVWLRPSSAKASRVRFETAFLAGVVLLVQVVFGISAQAQTATSLDGTGSNPDVLFDTGVGCWYVDSDANATKDSGEVCIEDGSIRFARDFAAGSTTGGINEAIADCGTNASGSGCHIWLPPGEVLIGEPIQIGGLSGNDQQYGITLHGHGSGLVDISGNERCGTILRPDAGFVNNDPMVSVDGSVYWRLKDFCIEGAQNGKNAGWGILIRADNSPSPGCCANNSHGLIDSVWIVGIKGSPGIGIAIAGNNDDSQPGNYPTNYHNDQVDFVTISHSVVRNSVECFRQDSQQAVLNRLQGFTCSKWTGTYGIVVLWGRVLLDDVYIGATEASQVGIRWEHGASRMEASNLVFEWGGDNGTFVQFAGPSGTTGIPDAHTIRASRFQSQFAATVGHTFIDFSRRGTLNLIGNRFFVGTSSVTMGDFDLDAPHSGVPTYVNFLGNEYTCFKNGIDCSPTINITNSGGGGFPSGGIRVTRQEEGVFRVSDEGGSVAPATTYRFYGKDLDASQVGKCLRTDHFDVPQACGPADSVATTAVLAPHKARVGALACAGAMSGVGSIDLGVRFRDGSATTDATAQLTRDASAGAAALSWIDVDETSPYEEGLISVVLDSVSSSPSGDLVCSVEVFH